MANVEASTPGPIAATLNTSCAPSDSILPGDTPAQAEAAQPSEQPIQEQPMEAKQSEMTTVPSSIRKMTSKRSTTFHIPALVGRPGVGKTSLRKRPVLASCDPQSRKCFTLTIYAILSGQVATTALIAVAITASILSPGGLLPNAMGPHDIFWMPGYPFDVVMALLPIGFCTVVSFVGLSFSRTRQMTSRSLLVGCTFFTGIFLGMLTYLEDYVAMFFIGIVLMSLVLHMFGVGVNLVSSLAKLFGPVEPKASKVEVMGPPGQGLSGTEKFICILYDEDAAYTRASLALAGVSWFVATLTAALIFVEVHELVETSAGVPFCFSAGAAGLFVLYFTYGVEKQLRRCNPQEKEKAMINLTIDLFFFVAECASFDLKFLKWQELGSAQPGPAVMKQVSSGMKQVSSGMKQMSSATTQSTAVSTSASKSTTPPRTTAV